MSGDDTFYTTTTDLDELEAGITAAARASAVSPIPDDVPALRELGRPPSWSAARSPATLLGPQYASAARRAKEILRHI